MLILAETDISVSCVGKGQFIRWYLNGWHYLFLEQGSESQVVEGTEALPSSYSRLALQAYGLKEGDLRAAKTVAFAPSLDLLTVDGWKNAILESGSVETKRTGASLYPISLTVNVFGKVADYSPVAEVVPPLTDLTDLDILRQIRAANPTSQLPEIWLDSEDPYTQWEGVDWESDRVVQLYIADCQIISLDNIGKLSALTYLSCDRNNLTSLNVSGLSALTYLSCSRNNITSLNVSELAALFQLICTGNSLTFLDVSGLTGLYQIYCDNNNITSLNVSGADVLGHLYCNNNQLTSIPSLTSKGTVIGYNFTRNNLPTAELDRFRAMGFTDESRLLPQNP